jgi:hypothetical protein
MSLHNVAQSTTVSKLKNMIYEKQSEAMPIEEMRLIYVKYQLEDGRSFYSRYRRIREWWERTLRANDTPLRTDETLKKYGIGKVGIFNRV